ncbi:hypothetical protein Tco_0278472, partial [Tanacetum coccineum]
MAEDASSKKFLVSNFTNYKMTDSRLVIEQYNELFGILGRFTQHKMNMDEAIQVFCIIDKLLLSWKDFKHTLKHKKEELTFVELGSHQHIDESLRVQDIGKPKGNNVAGPSVVNMVYYVPYVSEAHFVGSIMYAELKRMQNVPYASVVGSIMYAVRCTRPDVAFAQNITSRFQQNPGDLHWTTVKNILKYLRNTKDMFLAYGECQAKHFATSSVEAEYIATYDASKEAVWVRKFISGLGVVPTIEEPISMYCDNTGAINIDNESGITKGARHFRAKVHYLREVIEFGDIKLEKVHTYDNLA